MKGLERQAFFILATVESERDIKEIHAALVASSSIQLDGLDSPLSLGAGSDNPKGGTVAMFTPGGITELIESLYRDRQVFAGFLGLDLEDEAHHLPYGWAVRSVELEKFDNGGRYDLEDERGNHHGTYRTFEAAVEAARSGGLKWGNPGGEE